MWQLQTKVIAPGPAEAMLHLLTEEQAKLLENPEFSYRVAVTQFVGDMETTAPQVVVLVDLESELPDAGFYMAEPFFNVT